MWAEGRAAHRGYGSAIHPGLATDPGTAPLVVLLGFAVLGAAPWRRPAGEPGQGPAAPDAPSAARPEVPAGAGEGTH